MESRSTGDSSSMQEDSASASAFNGEAVVDTSVVGGSDPSNMSMSAPAAGESAPQWVRALQAALHADMEEDDDLDDMAPRDGSSKRPSGPGFMSPPKQPSVAALIKTPAMQTPGQNGAASLSTPISATPLKTPRPRSVRGPTLSQHSQEEELAQEEEDSQMKRMLDDMMQQDSESSTARLTTPGPSARASDGVMNAPEAAGGLMSPVSSIMGQSSAHELAHEGDLGDEVSPMKADPEKRPDDYAKTAKAAEGGSSSSAGESGSSKHPSSSRRRRESRRIPPMYGRVISLSKNLDAAKFCPAQAPSIKDSLGQMFSRENKEVVNVKKRLRRYKLALQAELLLVQKVITMHTQHKDELLSNLREQELQLKRWALTHLYRTFHLQAWLRASRCELMITMAKHIEKILEAKGNEAQAAADRISMESKANKNYVLPAPFDAANIDKYCASPEGIAEADSQFQALQVRLHTIDKLCHRSLQRFRSKLPELESKSHNQRAAQLMNILTAYSAILTNTEPKTKPGESLTWDAFIMWSVKRQSDQNDLEREYLSFVEDERETEGRLFRRWCILMNPQVIEAEMNVLAVKAVGGGPSNTAPVAPSAVDRQSVADVHGALGGAPPVALAAGAAGATVPAAAAAAIAGSKQDMVLSPRTVIAFIRYFARDVIGKLYNIPVLSELEDALYVLTEQLIYRRISNVIFRYQTNGRTERRDRLWRLKCSRCRLMDPVSSYGVAPEFLQKVQAPAPARTTRASVSGKSFKRNRASGSGRASAEAATESNADVPSTPEPTAESMNHATPSFLKRLAVPLGQDLLALLNASNTAVEGAPEAEADDANVSKQIGTSSLAIDASSVSPAPALSAPISPVNLSSTSAGASVGPSAFSEPEPAVSRNKSYSISAFARQVGDISMLRCPGCDACRGRISRPRLSLDFCSGVTSMRFYPTMYPNQLISAPDTVMLPPSQMPSPLPQPSASQQLNRRSSRSNADIAPSTGPTTYVRVDKSSVIFWHDNFKYATPFKRSIRCFSMLSSTVCAKDMLFFLTWGMKWLHSDALDATGKNDFLGADLMIPLLVLCLVHAKIPCIHLIMQFIRNYGCIDPCGESAYIMTCVEAAVAFIDRLEVIPELEEEAAQLYSAHSTRLKAAGMKRNGSSIGMDMHATGGGDLQGSSEGGLATGMGMSHSASSGNLAGEDETSHAGGAQVTTGATDEDLAMEKLGEWLRDQKAMEDTIGILQQEGWME